jgi:hypothetical protein
MENLSEIFTYYKKPSVSPYAYSINCEQENNYRTPPKTLKREVDSEKINDVLHILEQPHKKVFIF